MAESEPLALAASHRLVVELRSRCSVSGIAAMTTRAFPVLIWVALVTPLSGLAATAPIYKCVDANLRVLYTDEPCKGGQQLNIRPGDADPAAVARLQLERDALNQSTAQRIAEQRRQEDRAGRYMLEDNQRTYEFPSYDYGAVWWLPGIARSHPEGARRPKAHEPRRFAPTPPNIAMPRH
jgi:hypothetical protein